MSRYGLFEVADVTFYDLVTNKPVLYLNSLKITNIENKAATVYAQGGKGNAKILAFDKTREALVKLQDALITEQGLNFMSGNNKVTGATTVNYREQLVAVAGTGGTGSKVTLTNTTGAALVAIFHGGDAGTGTDITAKGTLASPDVTFATTDVPVGDTVYVYYTFTTNSSAEVITITAKDFPPFVKIVGDTVIRNTATGLDEKFAFVLPKAKIMPTFTLTMQADGNPTVFDMDLEAFITDNSPELYHLIKYTTTP